MLNPDLISAQQLQYYVLPRNNDDGLAPSSMRICYSALRFFYHQVVERPWQTLELMRAQTAQRLQPCSASQRSTASSRLGRLCTIASPTTLYSGGRRLNEALSLHVGDIDGART